MKTTFTLQKDVAARLQQVARKRRQPIAAVVNEALRAGLPAVEYPGRQDRALRPADRYMGQGADDSLDDLDEVLSR
jgi:predicted transcriptional regulator